MTWLYYIIGKISPYILAPWCIDNSHMQELKVWSSFIHLRHRQASYDMAVLPECLPDPFKKLSLPVIFLRKAEKYAAFG
jgi:hypothetical protein